MKPHQLFAAAMDPSRLFLAQGMKPDPWQNEVLLCPSSYVLLNCSRGAGKTRVTSVLALLTALFEPGSLTLLISRSQRQAVELLRYIKQGYLCLGRPVAVQRYNETQVEFTTGSRIIALPGREETIRSFQGVNLLILDEAARIPDILYGSVRPMTGTVQGRTICLSTPFGQRGFFWRAWCDTAGPWTRFCVPWQRCPRLTAEFIEQERRQFGDAWIAQEYECDFTACEGLVYPDFDGCIVWEDWKPPQHGKRVGGIDWGFRNPFAAVWGVLDRDDVLWIEGERYLSHTPLHEHAAALPAKTIWYADPSGATEIYELLAAGHVVRAGNNDIRAGIQAVTARLQTDRLKVHGRACPNLVRESRLYRYPREQERHCIGENPVDDNNHALGALRYLISKLDAKTIARFRRQPAAPAAHAPSAAPPEPAASLLAGGASPDERATPTDSPQCTEPTFHELMNDPNMWTGFP